MRANTGFAVHVNSSRTDLNVIQQSSRHILYRFLFNLGDGLCPIVGSLAAALILIGLSGLMN